MWAVILPVAIPSAKLTSTEPSEKLFAVIPQGKGSPDLCSLLLQWCLKLAEFLCFSLCGKQSLNCFLHVVSFLMPASPPRKCLQNPRGGQEFITESEWPWEGSFACQWVIYRDV